ncbi:MAG TPA: hypothetical protein PL064_02275, partial [Thermogutta sp.]|nr:hypothetical protein [Thermogutta sp.]
MPLWPRSCRATRCGGRFHYFQWEEISRKGLNLEGFFGFLSAILDLPAQTAKLIKNLRGTYVCSWLTRE